MKKNDSDVIKEAIAYLHERQSGDYQTLLRQVEAATKKKVIYLNAPQIVASMSRARVLALEWGRGTGKTTILGHRLNQVVANMPRSTGLIIEPTYKMFLTRVLPSLTQGMEMFGLYEGLHYFIGQQPPPKWRASWPKAYQPPRDYSHYITWWTGAGAHLISQDVPGDGRGLNSDWHVADEAALLNAEKIQENTSPTLRGTNTAKFKNVRFFGSQLWLSSTPITPEGSWFIDIEEKARRSPRSTHFISANCLENLHNLRPGYLEQAREDSVYQWLFEAEYLNVRPQQVRDGFYPLFRLATHAYQAYDYSNLKQGSKIDCRIDSDLIPGVPLVLGIDWGATINCLTVNQYNRDQNEYRTLKDMFVLGDNQHTQEDLIKDLSEYYKPHQSTCKTMLMFCDNTGNNRTGITKLTRAQLAQKQLAGYGWDVRIMTVGGSNVSHEDKHVLWNLILAEKDPRYPRYRINRNNCPNLIISMSYARAIPTNNGVKKDKSSERSKSIKREHATDLSDANDTPIYGLFSQLLRGIAANSGMLPGLRT